MLEVNKRWMRRVPEVVNTNVGFVFIFKTKFHCEELMKLKNEQIG